MLKDCDFKQNDRISEATNSNKTTSATSQLDVLNPELSDTLVASTKIISYANSRTYRAGSLAWHMDTTKRKVCDTARKDINKKTKTKTKPKVQYQYSQ